MDIGKLRYEFASICKDVLINNKSFNKDIFIDGIITDSVKRDNHDNLYFNISCKDLSSSLPVFVHKDIVLNTGKELFKCGVDITVKGRLHVKINSYVKNFDILQLHVSQIIGISKETIRFTEALQYVNAHRRKPISLNYLYENKPNIRVALITSISGEGYNDVVTALAEVKDNFDVILINTDTLDVDKIVGSINSINKESYDILAIVRGGTSQIEIFNDVKILKALYEKDIITICGIGHANQTPLIEKIVDYKTSTPTACGALLRDSYNEFLQKNKDINIDKELKKHARRNRVMVFVLAVAILIVLYFIINKIW